MANLHVRLVILFLIVLVSTCLSGFATASAQTHNTVSLADTYNVIDPNVTMMISANQQVGVGGTSGTDRVYDLTFESEQSGAAAPTDNFIVDDIYYTPTNRYGGSGVEASLSSFTSTSSNSFTAQFTVPADTFATLLVPSSSFKISGGNGGNNVAAHWSNIVDFISQKVTGLNEADITADILSQAGLEDVDVDNEVAYRAAIAASTAGTLSTVDAIQNLIDSVNASVDAIAKVAAAAANGNANGITIADLDAIIGLSSVIDNYLGAYQAAIATSTADSLSDVAAIQALITGTNTAISGAVPSGCVSDEDCTSIAVTTTAADETVSIRLFSVDNGLSGINVNFNTGGASCSSVSATEGDGGTSGTVVNDATSSAIVDISTAAGYVTLSCAYSAVGTYTIVVNGSFEGYGWQAENAADVSAITAVNQWSNDIKSLQGAFKGHSALISVPSLPSGVTNTASMFEGAIAFNQDIGGWDTSAVTGMSSMFDGATAFNQDIGDWDTGVVEDMSSMFESATVFNQDLSKWDVSNVTDMTDIFASAELSVNHYDALITSWNAQLSLQGVSFNGGTSKFCEAAVSGTDQDPSDSANTVYDCSPRIIRVTLAVGDDLSTLALTVTFSEPVFANANGTGALEANDFEVIFSHRVNGALDSGTPTSISQNGNSYTLGVSIFGLGITVDNDLVIKVLPKADSIYDANDNDASDS